MKKQLSYFKDNLIKVAFAVLLFFVAGMQQVNAQATVRYQKNIKGGASMIGNSWFYVNTVGGAYGTAGNQSPLRPDLDGDPLSHLYLAIILL